jgi:uncharacterized protein YecE (DUF72 family)
MAQLDLFGPHRAAPRRSVGPASQPPELLTLGRRPPPAVRLGTSSWSFPGWRGLVYDRDATPAALAREGLPAYAAHPLLRTVGLDRTYYGPMTREALGALAAQVPATFRFVVKALESATIAVFPRHARHGAQAGQPNPRFLDPEPVTAELLHPLIDGLGAVLGPIVFQLPPQPPDRLGGPARFAMRLRAFLRNLPAGPAYAVEVRTRELVGPDLARALADTGAVPCLTGHPAMPPITVQAEAFAAASAGPLVVRWMLGPGQEYDAARARYAPFDRIVDADPAARTAIVGVVRSALGAGRHAYVVVNNKAEGSAPASIALLARALVDGAS